MKRMMRKKRMKGGRKRRKRKSSLRQAEQPVQAAVGAAAAAAAAAGRWKFSRLVAPAGDLTHTPPPKPFLSQPTDRRYLATFTESVKNQQPHNMTFHFNLSNQRSNILVCHPRCIEPCHSIKISVPESDPPELDFLL